MNALCDEWRSILPASSLDAVGLIALADLSTIARRTASLGSSSLLDALVLCPGIHRQQNAADLNKGEFPATAALTTGYVFRIENQATVAYLQRVGITGHMVTLSVEKLEKGLLTRLKTALLGPSIAILPSLLVLVAASLTCASLILLVVLIDWWGFAILLSLISARSLNIMLICRRTKPGWHGALEPGKKGDLLVLLSQDRWLRLQGPVDSLKTVTSGQWLNDMTFFDSSLEASATLLVYLSAALASNASATGKIILLALLLVSVGLVGISNELEEDLYMHNHIVKKKGQSRAYARRLDLAQDLIKETGRSDWAIELGMVNAKDYGEKSPSKAITL